MTEGEESNYGKDIGQMDAFNLAVAVIFEYFLHQFPIKQAVSYKFFVEEKLRPVTEVCQEDTERGTHKYKAGEPYIKNSNIPPREYIAEIIGWLKLEGFLHEFAEKGFPPKFQLTSKALAILNATPSGVDQPLRSKLGNAVKESGTAAGKAAISSVVGLIIGAAARSFFGIPLTPGPG